MTWPHYLDQVEFFREFLNYFGNVIYKIFEVGPSKYCLEFETKITQKKVFRQNREQPYILIKSAI